MPSGNKNNAPLSDGWSFVSRRMSQERGWWPNRVAYNKQNVLICVQCAGENRDFSLSATALIDLIAALENKQVKAGAVRLTAADGSFVAEKPAQYVWSRLAQFQPDVGRFGPHWWSDAEFEALEPVNPVDDCCPM